MKSILVLTGGSSSDAPVFETALAAARLFSAHLQFLHIRISAGQAAAYAPHMGFVSGPPLREALSQLETEAEQRSAGFADHVREFCARSLIAIQDTPAAANGVTASWCEERNDAEARLVRHARHHELMVMGRAKRPNGLPPDLVETLLLQSGRPVLLASGEAPRSLTGTIMVCWRDSADAARALGAAMPFLSKASRVVLVGVEEKGNDIEPSLEAVAAQLAWRGIATEVRAIAPKGRATADLLKDAADACAADLVVLGAYGHSRFREVIFGGCTQAVIGHADRPVLMLH